MLFMDRRLIRALDKDKNSALMWAVKRNQYEIARALIQKGADPFQKNLLQTNCIDWINKVSHP